MAGSSEIEQVKQASDIVEEIGARISLQRVGANFRALCPFHSEKSPSFYVSETMQRFKCFGCGETGDVFTFLEKYDGMTFGEALRHLADRAGITLANRSVDRKDEERVTLLSILELAKDYYQYVLNTHTAGEKARQYLIERGITSESRKVYTLGFALPEWDGLATYLLKKKRMQPELVAETGLIIKGRSGWYDRFRNRVMFPLRDARGVVVGFSGRILVGDDTSPKEEKEAKYINTPETTLYHKGKLLYGYAEHWQSIRDKKEIVLVEGEFDVISSGQAHLTHVAGLKGSALTTDHVRILSRTVDRIILSLDADSAGVEATKRAVAVLQDTPLSRNTPLDLRVSVVPEGKDPDELARKDPKAWRTAVKQSIPAYEYLITTACSQQDIATAVGKQKVLYEIAPIINAIQHQVEREHYLQLIAQLLQANKESVATDIATLGARKLSQGVRKEEPPSEVAPKKLSPLATLESYILFLWTKLPDDDFVKAIDQLDKRNWVVPFAAGILKVASQKQPSSLKRLATQLPDDLQQSLFELHTNPQYESHLAKANLHKEWEDSLKKLQRLEAQEQSKAIGELLALLDKKQELSSEEKQQQAMLLQQLANLMAKQRVE